MNRHKRSAINPAFEWERRDSHLTFLFLSSMTLCTDASMLIFLCKTSESRVCPVGVGHVAVSTPALQDTDSSWVSGQGRWVARARTRARVGDIPGAASTMRDLEWSHELISNLLAKDERRRHTGTSLVACSRTYFASSLRALRDSTTASRERERWLAAPPRP